MKKKRTKQPAVNSAAGNTPLASFRLSTDTIADLETIASTLGLSSKTEALRYAVRTTASKLRRVAK